MITKKVFAISCLFLALPVCAMKRRICRMAFTSSKYQRANNALELEIERFENIRNENRKVRAVVNLFVFDPIKIVTYGFLGTFLVANVFSNSVKKFDYTK